MKTGFDVLYISYDGLLEPIGKSQIIPYLKGLAKQGSKLIVLSFEKNVYSSSNGEAIHIKKELHSLGIFWRVLRYHKAPALLATLFDACYGVLFSFYLIKRHGIKIIHARSYVAALLGLILKNLCKVKFIFDMRGFWAEERVEAGIWEKGSLLYKIAKYFEKIFLQNADVIVVLTRAAKNEIAGYSYLSTQEIEIASIPTCVDLDRFYYKQVGGLALSQKIKGRPVFVYSGSISTWFMPEQIIDFFTVTRKLMPQAHFLVLTKEVELFRNILSQHRFKQDCLLVLSVDYESMPDYLSLAQVGLAFYKPGYSRKGRCPTKIGEYLACGLPVIINAGVGDTDQMLKKERVGIIIQESLNAEYERVNRQLQELLEDSDLQNRCHQVAERYFSLSKGIEEYRKIYDQLLKT